MNITRRLAEFCHQILSLGIPAEVEERAKICIADVLHAILLSLPSRTSNMLGQYLDQSPRKGFCSAVGRGSADAEAAALFNASLAAVHEIDDVHFDTSLHPGAVVVPASLAAAELSEATVGRFLAAIVAGYEVAVRLSKAAGQRHYHYFHASATCGTIGAAAAASVALNLTLEQTNCALGLAATSASGLWEGITDQAVMVKHLHLGLASERGIRSARLAALGWPGASSAIEGPKGFLAALARPAELTPGEEAGQESLEQILAKGLGETWAIQRNIFKRYPFCLGVSEPLEGLRELLQQSPYGSGKIDSILVETSPSVAWMVGNKDPRNDEEARFSVPFALSLVLAGFDPETVPLPSVWLKDQGVREWLPRVRIEGRPDIGRRKARVTATLRDGTRIEADQPLRNLTESEVLRRLDRVSQQRLGVDGCRLTEVVAGLSRCQDLLELRSILRGKCKL